MAQAILHQSMLQVTPIRLKYGFSGPETPSDCKKGVKNGYPENQHGNAQSEDERAF
jgi:hypothetical protein